MIICEKCANCEKREWTIDMELPDATRFWRKNGEDVTYIFSCGAIGNSNFIESRGSQIVDGCSEKGRNR